MQQTLKSPITRKTLNQAGESLRRAQLDLIDDKLLTPSIAVAILWGVAAVEWIWTWQGIRPTPVYLTIAAGLFTVAFLWRTRATWKILKQIKLGIDGERAVGEYLDRLRGLGLPMWIGNAPERVAIKDVKHAASRLAAFVREHE